MAEVRYTKIGYCRYKSMENVMGLLFNTVFGFIMGLFAFSYELDGTIWRWIMLSYAVGSVVYAGYAMPKYLLTLKWVTDRPEKEVVEIEILDPGTVQINGFCWDLSYWNKPEIVVDCESGIAYIPFKSKQKEVLYR